MVPSLVVPRSKFSDEDHAALVRKISASRKYRVLSPVTIGDIVMRELATANSFKNAEHAVRSKLHKILASYHVGKKFGREWAMLDQGIGSGSDEAVRAACRALMSLHATSAERLELLEIGYYERIFEKTGTPSTIIDLACAFHPLGLRWMGLPKRTVYYAYDANIEFVDMVRDYFLLEGIDGMVIWSDILCQPPACMADLAFFLQTYHCVEARRAGGGLEIVDSVPARWVVLSLPKESFGGRPMQRLATFASDIQARAATRGWPVYRVTWPREEVWIIHKNDIAETPGNEGLG
jgi:16S rRNA (guanine(1405)-N(7))-methyltransferase